MIIGKKKRHHVFCEKRKDSLLEILDIVEKNKLKKKDVEKINKGGEK